MSRAAIGSWRDVEGLLQQRPLGAVVKVPKGWLEHPLAHGMRRTFALPAGQLADYWKRIDEDTGFHVLAFSGHYLALLEPLDLASEAGGVSASTSTSIKPLAGRCGVALGALIGVALGRTAGAVFAAAAVGGLLVATSRELREVASSFEEAGGAAAVPRR